MKTIKKISAIGLISSLAVLTAACGPESPSSDSTAASGSGRSVESGASARSPEEALELAARSVENAPCEVSELQKEMLELVNKARAEGRYCGEEYYEAVAPVTWNCTLVKAAEIHNADMSTNNFFAHEGSDGLKAGARLDRVGYNWSTYGENLAAGFIEPKEAMEALLASPGHCRNIMGKKYEEFGAASVFYTKAEYSHYWTQVYGTQF